MKKKAKFNFKFSFLNLLIVVFVIALLGGAYVYFVRGGVEKNFSNEIYGGESSIDYDYVKEGVMPMGVNSAIREPSFIQETVSDSVESFDDDSFSQERMVIRSASLSLAVSDVQNTVSAISKYASSNSGYIISSNIGKSGGVFDANVSIKIPVENFARALSDVKNMGELVRESTSGSDITEEYVDLTARLKSLKATEAQFMKVLDKANNVQDILAVERELKGVRMQIESMEGRMKYMEKSSAMATLSIYLSTADDAKPVLNDDETYKPLAVFKDALRSFIDFAQSVLNFIIWFVVYIPALLLIIGVLYLMYHLFMRFFVRKSRK